MSKDFSQADPAEGSREVIEHELKRHENDPVEPPKQAKDGGKKKREPKKPH